MIYYNSNIINDWNFGDDNIIKVYKHGAVVYYKFDSEQGGYKVCYAVVDDITQYSETEFDDVYDKATEKWYKLNNLNQYEEYGIYGSGRTSCEGSASRLPQGYTEVEYVKNTSTAYIDTGAYLNTSNFEVGYTFWGNRAQWGYVHQNVGSGAWITTANDYAYMGRFDSSYRVAIGSYLTSDENTIVYTQSGVTVNGTSISKNLNLSGTDNLNASPLLFFVWYDFYRAGVEHSFNSKVKSFYLKNNGILVRDFVPCKRDSDNKYGMYDLVTDTFYLSPNNIDFSGGSPVTPTDCVTTYNGKLTIDDGYEYEWNGSSWVNLGEVSGSSKSSDFKIGDIDNPITSDASLITDGMHGVMLPVSLSANTSSAVALMGSSDSNTLSNLSSHTKTSVISENDIIDYAVWKFHGTATANTFYMENVATKKYFGYSNVSIDYMPLVDESSKVPTVFSAFTKDNVTAFGICKGNTPYQYYAINDLYGSHYQYNWFNPLSSAGDLNNSYVIYKVKGSDAEYPKYYSEKDTPLDSLTFNTLADAQAYAEANCVYDGMHATIDGDKYVFSGDSQSGYEWVYNPSRLPVGYTEVEYVQNTGTSYFNTNFVPNQDTRVVCDMQNVTASNYPRLWGAGAWNSATGLNIDYNPNNFQVSWLGKTTWTDYSAYPTSISYNRHTYDLNKNYVYIDEALVGSNTYTTRTASDPIGVFTYISSGRPSSSSYWGQEHFKGKMYSFQIYDNGTLVRDLVPCIKDSDNTVGAYDIVNDVFYTVPTRYTTDKLVAGDPV